MEYRSIFFGSRNFAGITGVHTHSTHITVIFRETRVSDIGGEGRSFSTRGRKQEKN